MITWPADLPRRQLLEGYSEAPPARAIRSAVDVGPAKVRRRYTGGARRVTCSVLLQSRAQKAALDTFYDTTLQSGVLPFQWLDVHGHLQMFRFISKEDDPGLSYEPLAPEKWRASMQLEIL